ncbi:hypothetical protein HaLaN_06157 [Haematococcus lacustris]|uniref:Uncharacterized protein n=1 Tax=Haematococcus lacustris TaxID=44745 RepID=A0A699YMN7_HAELA|nr:hypothetical protein HaLaN_06157 [Haematococcus lacustris]
MPLSKLQEVLVLYNNNRTIHTIEQYRRPAGRNFVVVVGQASFAWAQHNRAPDRETRTVPHTLAAMGSNIHFVWPGPPARDAPIRAGAHTTLLASAQALLHSTSPRLAHQRGMLMSPYLTTSFTNSAALPAEQRQSTKVTAMQTLGAAWAEVSSRFRPPMDPTTVSLTYAKKPVRGH